MANGVAAQLGRLALTTTLCGDSSADGMTIWPPDPTMDAIIFLCLLAVVMLYLNRWGCCWVSVRARKRVVAEGSPLPWFDEWRPFVAHQQASDD